MVSEVVAAALGLWTAAAVDVGSGLQIEAGTPGDPCPDVTSARVAIRGRLGGVLVDEGEGSWRVRYSTFYAPENRDRRVLRVEIFDPAGQLDRRRDLPTAGATCEAMAQALALVVENRFRQPDASIGAPLPEVAVAEAPPRVEPRRERLTLAVEGAGELGGGPRAGVALGVAGRLARRWWLRLGATVPPGARTEDLGALSPGAEASVSAVPVRADLGFAAVDGERVRVELGPEVYASVERARADGLTTAQPATRFVWGGGAGVRASLHLQAGLRLVADASVVGTLPLAASQLTIEQQGQRFEVLRQPAVVAQVAAGLAYSFFW
jgi:hypothetical protein